MSVNSYKIDEKSEKVSKRNTLLRLYKYMLEYRWQIVVVIVIMFITIGITVYITHCLLKWQLMTI